MLHLLAGNGRRRATKSSPERKGDPSYRGSVPDMGYLEDARTDDADLSSGWSPGGERKIYSLRRADGYL